MSHHPLQSSFYGPQCLSPPETFCADTVDAAEHSVTSFLNLDATFDLRLRIAESVYHDTRIQSLLNGQRSSYNPETRLLKVNAMARPVHVALADLVSDFLVKVNRSGWLTAEESVLVGNAIPGVRLARSRFSVGSNVKKREAWTNYPDAVLKFRRLPTVVFEVGFSEKYCSER
jgi:hypothetical protein